MVASFFKRLYNTCMSDVEFEEYKIDEMRKPENSESFITKLVMKTGLVKDQKGANVVMVIISIVCIAVAIYFAIK